MRRRGSRLVNPQTATPVMDFVSVWDTRLISSGSSMSNQVRLPLHSQGDYDFTVNWGDGNANIIKLYDAAEILHTYSASGVYTVTITGKITGILFGGNTDCKKILEVISWGSLKLGNQGLYFQLCSNLTLTNVSDILTTSDTTNFQAMFDANTSLGTINRVNEWDMSQATSLSSMFRNCDIFNQDLNEWDVGNVTNFVSMFQNTDLFNGNIESWNMSSALYLIAMFSSAKKFNKNISNWNISSAIDMSNFLRSATMFSVYNYDALLIGWASRPVMPDVSVKFATKYSSAASSAREILTSSPNNWVIIDLGLV